MGDETDLTAEDKALLQARLEEYHLTANPAKEAFRVACAKYILRTRQLDESDVYKIKLITGKVRNWFHNHTEKRSGRLPLRIYNDFSPMRIWGHKNRDLVRDTVAEANDDEEPDERAYIVQWNETVHKLWDELPEDEQRPYVRLAELWAIQGPDDELKPWMAEKRGPVWMRSVGSMFWTQCGMPVFIYGMFKDTNGRLRATVYDTTELWADADPTTPLFRNVKGWDQDFRRKAWTFFQAILEPEQASQDTLALVQGTRRQPAAPFTFELHSDGTPILTDKENGKPTPTYRRQHILREYLRIHYSHASGREARAVPWQSLRENQAKFFTAGMLPEGFLFEDPSKITDDQLVAFFNHVSAIEMRPEGQENRFRFSNYQTGPKGNYTYPVAIYSGQYAPHEPRRARKTVQPPSFEGAPLDDVSGDSRSSERAPGLARGLSAPGGSRLTTVLDADLEKVQRQIAAMPGAAATPTETSAAATPTETSEASTAVPSPSPKVLTPPEGAQATGTKGKNRADEPWLDAEFVTSGDQLNDGWDDVADDFLEEAWVQVSAGPQGPKYDLEFASDDEVEGVLNQKDSGADDGGTGTLAHATPSHAQAPIDAPRSTPTFASPPAPQTVAAEGSARYDYLRGLATDVPYQAMLVQMETKACAHSSVASLREVAVIRGKSPVFWVTWGHKAGHVPQATQCAEKNVKALIKWIQKVPPATSSPADAQRYCLAVGLLLSDLHFIADTEGVLSWPEHLPGYLAYSEFNSEHTIAVTEACQAALTEWTPSISAHAATQAAMPAPPAPSTLPVGGPATETRTRGHRQGNAPLIAPEPPTLVGRVTRARSRAQ